MTTVRIIIIMYTSSVLSVTSSEQEPFPLCCDMLNVSLKPSVSLTPFITLEIPKKMLPLILIFINHPANNYISELTLSRTKLFTHPVSYPNIKPPKAAKIVSNQTCRFISGAAPINNK